MPTLRLFALILSIALSSAATAAPAVPANVIPESATDDALLQMAENAFESGVELLLTDPAAGRARLAESIAAYRLLIERGHDNAAIRRNIGNAYMRSGDLGRAVAAFRRAEAIDPVDPRVQDSLAAARAMVRTEVASGTRQRAADAVLFWRGWIGRDAVLAIGLVAWAGFWIAAAVRIFTRRGVGAAVVMGLVTLVTLGSLALERTLEAMNRQVVIVADGVTAYRGPSEAVYDPAFEQPLRAGVEGVVVERREGWERLRLRSGAEAWVPTSAVEEI